MTQQLFNRRTEVTVDNGTEVATFVSSNSVSSLAINFDSEFTDEPTPCMTTITIFNLSENSRKKIKKGAKVVLKAGYVGDIGVISEGKINKIYPINYDGTTKETTFSFIEGTDYSEKSDVEMTFGKGTYASSIISRIASKAGIPIAKVELSKNKLYSKGYTADGNPLNTLQEIVEACNSSMYFRRGKLIIRDIKKGDDERFVLEQKTGLISYPQRFEEDDGSGWQVRSLLQHRIATASIIELKSKYAKGTFRVRNGTHSSNGSTFETSCEVV